MKGKLTVFFLFLALMSLLVLGVYYLFDRDMVVLNPKGIVSAKQKDLIIMVTLLMLIVVIPVFVLTLGFAWKYRVTNKNAKYEPNRDYHLLAEIVWWSLPTAIVIVLSFVTWKGCHDLDPFKPIKNGEKPITIQVVALDWKWLFIYPEYNIASVNFFQIPERTPIHLEITSDAPMNSFWLPQLAGQIFAMSGMKTQLHLVADEIGDYRGSSANISGKGFSGMVFTARASSLVEFQDWIRNVKNSGSELNVEEYNHLAKPSEYHPVTYYVVKEKGLFEWIVMKFMMPSSQEMR